MTPEGSGETLGTVTISDSSEGVVFKLALRGLPPGPHGFHVHENANCEPAMLNGVRAPGGAAGDHLDPEHANKHQGPEGDGHLGDLPVLDVEPNGTATQALTAPRIKMPACCEGMP